MHPPKETKHAPCFRNSTIHIYTAAGTICASPAKIPLKIFSTSPLPHQPHQLSCLPCDEFLLPKSHDFRSSDTGTVVSVQPGSTRSDLENKDALMSDCGAHCLNFTFFLHLILFVLLPISSLNLIRFYAPSACVPRAIKRSEM